jgi:hypothetical protein
VDADLLRALKAFTSADRLRILGFVAGRPATASAIGDALGLAPARVTRELALLRRAGLIEFDRESREPAHAVALGRLNEIGRLLEGLEPAADSTSAGTGPAGETLPAEDARVLRAFFEGPRLTSIPAQEKKRLVVLRYVLERCFPEDRAYPEKEVNQRLALVNRDVASLRRYLVDGGLMTRASGLYRRVVPVVDE